MGADNVDAFQRLVFSVPPLRVQAAALVVLSAVYGVLTVVSITLFTPFVPDPSRIVPVAVLIFLLPFAFAAELFPRVLDGYPRSWSYFLALTAQFVLFVYALVLSGADNVGNAWSIIWLSFITLYLINILVLVVSTGIDRSDRILLVSLAEPAALIAAFYALGGSELGFATYRHVFAFGSLLIAAAFLVLVLVVVDYLIKSNTDVSAFALTSGILRNDRESLDLGVEARPFVETLAVDNGERLTLAAPWVHPGPLGGFGGGQLSTNVIDALNAGDDGPAPAGSAEGPVADPAPTPDGGSGAAAVGDAGFFLHVPCTHKEDLSNPADAARILDAVAAPDRTSRASRLVTRDYADREGYGDIRFHGRRIGDKEVIVLHGEGIDDYDTGVFMGDVDHDEVLLIDQHRHDIQRGPDVEIQYGSARADRLKRAFDDFREVLADAELVDDYAAGFEVTRAGQDALAMVEAVDGQEVLWIGVDTNGLTPDVREAADGYREAFDEVIPFSTDTHASIHELANMRESDVDAIDAAVEAAAADLSPATVGLASRRTEPVKLLKNDYNGLVFSVNILIRLTLIALVALYALLVLWLFF
jgi:putative membrane protein